MKPLAGKHFGTKHQKIREYVIQPPFETVLDDLKDPAFWSHCCSYLRHGDVVGVYPEGLPWTAHVIVIDADNLGAKVKVMHFVDLTTQKALAESPNKSDYTLSRAGRWIRVVRRSDNEVMKSGFSDEEAAREWAKTALAAEV
jgi:hypothetical protein